MLSLIIANSLLMVNVIPLSGDSSGISMKNMALLGCLGDKCWFGELSLHEYDGSFLVLFPIISQASRENKSSMMRGSGNGAVQIHTRGFERSVAHTS